MVGLILLLLDSHKIVESEIVAREFGNNCSEKQNVFIEDVLDAFDQNDNEKVTAKLNSSKPIETRKV